MPITLFIPWFRAESWDIPLPGGHTLPIQPFGVLVAMGILIGSRISEWRAASWRSREVVRGDRRA